MKSFLDNSLVAEYRYIYIVTSHDWSNATILKNQQMFYT